MSAGNAPGDEMLENPTFVAPLLPPTAPMPEPARRVGFFKAFALFWVMPKRLGPHLAVGSIWRALGVYLLSATAATTIVAAGLHVETLRYAGRDIPNVHLALADFVLDTAQSTVTDTGWWPALRPVATACGGVLGGALAALLLATLVMPWAAGGDRASSVWKRSVKNVYWSTTILVPAAVAVAIPTALEWELPRNKWLAVSMILSIMVVPPILVVRMLIVGASRYVGEPDGPAFAPREPTCDDCGYAIVHLPLGGRCPECGLPVRESLPGGRRQLTDWHRYELRPRGVRELVRLQWTVLRDPSFFQRLPVHAGIASARHFWWTTFLLMGFTGLLVSCLLAHTSVQSGRSGFPPLWEAGTFMAVVELPILFGLQAAVMFLACLWAQVRLGVRDYRASAVVCYFASPLMWPLIPIAIAGTVLLSDPVASWLSTGRVVSLWGAGIDLAVVVTVSLLVVAVLLVLLLFWRRRLLTALHAARYANV